MTKKQNKLLRCVALLLSVWMLSGCQQNNAKSDKDEEDDSAQQTQTAEQVVHLTLEKSVRFASDQTKASWREPLEAFLEKQIPHNWGDAEEQDYSNPYYGSFAIALMDLNLDGTPEILVAFPGGSACNVGYKAYDLHTGEKVLEFDGGVVEDWKYYYHPADDSLSLMGKFQMQAGVAEQHKHVVRIEYDAKQNTYTANPILYFSYNQQSLGNPDFQPIAIYKVNGDVVDAESYYNAAEAYIYSHLPISDTQMQLIDWDAVASKGDSPKQRAKAMAEALHSTKQAFIVD